MAAEQIRFLPAAAPHLHQQQQLQQPPPPQRKRWAGCLGGLSCFGKQKGGKRIVPATRIPEVSTSANQPNGAQVAGFNNQATALGPSLFAPPSSPASFANSALQSTAQSPNYFLSANSPGGPSSTMFATGPYAHETQLVSPPVFSTFTTQPSTAPLTPPPELAHLTTPSSPDVPFARFISSAADMKSTSKPNGAPKLSDSNFFCPATFAQYYLDQSSFSNSGGRLSVSRESDAYSNAGSGHQNRQNKTFKQDADELEAYRASFGFSADDIVTTTHYVEITDGLNEPFTITPLTSTKEQGTFHLNVGMKEVQRSEKLPKESPSPQFHEPEQKGDVSVQTTHAVSDDEGLFPRMRNSRSVRKHDHGLYSSELQMQKSSITEEEV